MRKRVQPVLVLIAYISCALVLLTCLTFSYVQTSVFRAQLRSWTIARLQHASGGPVELDSIGFEWPTLTAQLQGLVVHGTESAGSQPLLSIPSLRVSLRPASVFQHGIHVSSVSAYGPVIHLIVASDGTTNLPRQLQESSINELLDLQIGRFELQHGSLSLQGRTYPFTITGHNFNARLRAAAGFSGYLLNLSSRGMLVQGPCCREMRVDVIAQATLRRNLIQFQKLALRSQNSDLEVIGTVTHFSKPETQFRFRGELNAREAATELDLQDFRGGELKLQGVAHYDRGAGLHARGHLQGERISYSSGMLKLGSVDFTSAFQLSREALVLDQIDAKLLGGTFSGEATMRRPGSFQLAGQFTALNSSAVTAAFRKRVPWTASISGPITISAKSFRSPADLSFESRLELAPASGEIPISGYISVTKPANSGFTFGDSHLTLRNSRLAFHGSPATGLQLAFDSTSLSDVKPALTSLKAERIVSALPNLLLGGSVSFNGTLRNPLTQPIVTGTLALTKFQTGSVKWDQLRWTGSASSHSLELSRLVMDANLLHISAAGAVRLTGWRFTEDSALQLKAEYRGVHLGTVSSEWLSANLPIAYGIAAGTADLSGSVDHPSGNGHIVIDNFATCGEQFRRVEADARLSGSQIELRNASLDGVRGGHVRFSADYIGSSSTWHDGQLWLHLDAAQFPISNLNLARNLIPGLNGNIEIHLNASAHVADGVFKLLQADGGLALRDITVNSVKLGNVSARLRTESERVKLSLSGDLRKTKLRGSAEISLDTHDVIQGEMLFDRISLGVLYAVLVPAHSGELPFTGFAAGVFSFQGPLEKLALWRARVQLSQLAVASRLGLISPGSGKPAVVELHNSRPVVLDLGGGIADLRSFELSGTDARISASGSFGYLPKRSVKLNLDGQLDLQLLRLIHPSLEVRGECQIKGSVGGSLEAPSFAGRLEIDDGSLASALFPDSLTHVSASVIFKNQRAVIERFTAESGGGQVNVGGFISLARAGLPAYDLNARAEDVRVRYGGGISATGDLNLRLTGTSSSSLLSGSATISRLVLNPNTDLGSVLAGFTAATPAAANSQDFLSGLHMDIAVQSAPNLAINTALSRDVEAEIDLRLRGTPDRPTLLGSISANSGDIRVFGSRYSLNRGEVRFVNPAKIDPVLDLNLQTQTRGIAVNIMISGTLNKLNIAYRSDPPLQPREILALLTVGRTPQEAANVQSSQVTTNASALPSSANTVLGQAISPSSGRLSKLFGVTNIRIDPLIQGITRTPESRLTLEQQISRSITVTYVTNLEQTSEQIFRLEWSINTQYSVVAVRDDNGEFGIDIQYKKRFR